MQTRRIAVDGDDAGARRADEAAHRGADPTAPRAGDDHHAVGEPQPLVEHAAPSVRARPADVASRAGRGEATTAHREHGAGLLTGRVALVVGGGTGLGTDLAWGLTDAGAAVAVVGPSGHEPAVAAQLRAAGPGAVGLHAPIDTRAHAVAAFAAAAAELGPLDLIVHALTDPASLTPAAIADTDASAWDERCEAVLRGAIACAQAAWAQLNGRGGRLVFVTPTVTLTGAARLAPYVSALEGTRALAKSAARQWGAHGITVNCVAPPVGLVGHAAEPAGAAAPALGREPDGRTDVAPVVALLATSGAHFLTGATLTVDGGRVMAP